MPYERQPHPSEDLRLEAVIVSCNYDDVLAETLPRNLPHFDTLVVVTTHEDMKTQNLCRKLGVTCVPSDLIHKDNGPFNKGAAVNAGFNHFRFMGWRVHMDSDIILPRTFRRVLFNVVPLDKACLYSADFVNIYPKELPLLDGEAKSEYLPDGPFLTLEWAAKNCLFVESVVPRKVFPRTLDSLEGWLPGGGFQLWNAQTQRPYPNSLGNGAHDDESFSRLWPAKNRRLMPEFLLYHLSPAGDPVCQANYGGRTIPRMDA